MKQLKANYKNVFRTAQYFNELDRTQYIRMDGNESIDGLPKDFVKKVLAEIDSNYLATYPNTKKCTEAVAEYLGLDRENVLMTNGSDSALKMIFEIYVDNDDRVLMTNPTFEMYGVYTSMYGANCVRIEYDDAFEFPYEEYVAELKKGAKLAIIVNPNNPTGSVLNYYRLIELIEIAEAQGTIVIVDEAYFWFYDKTVTDKIKSYNNLIVLRTFSKIMGLAGIRLGFVAANEEIINDIKKVAPAAAVNTVALKFGEHLMKETAVIESLVADYKKNKQYLLEQLSKYGIQYLNTEANFVLIPCDADLKMVYEQFKEEKILIACRFGKYIRINIGNPSVTDEFIKAYNKILG